jgi:hypothetical protein
MPIGVRHRHRCPMGHACLCGDADGRDECAICLEEMANDYARARAHAQRTVSWERTTQDSQRAHVAQERF